MNDLNTHKHKSKSEVIKNNKYIKNKSKILTENEYINEKREIRPSQGLSKNAKILID